MSPLYALTHLQHSLLTPPSYSSWLLCASTWVDICPWGPRSILQPQAHFYWDWVPPPCAGHIHSRSSILWLYWLSPPAPDPISYILQSPIQFLEIVLTSITTQQSCNSGCASFDGFPLVVPSKHWSEPTSILCSHESHPFPASRDAPLPSPYFVLLQHPPRPAGKIPIW